MPLLAHITGTSLLGALCLLPACRDARMAADRPSRSAGDTGTAEPTPAEVVRARATITGPPGSEIKGEVIFDELEGNTPVPGVRIEARITGPANRLAPGPHGLHIHQTGDRGSCVPPYEGARGHFDPGPSSNPDPDVNHPFHLGDVPNLVVDEKGVGVMKATTSRITLSPGPLTLFDADGSAIIVHEKPDQGIPGAAKSGVSGGPRIACGVIQLE
jgi:Cu-Zn family superoxide dismutase